MPLCLASSFGNSNVVKVLLEHGAHVNQQNDVSIYYYYIMSSVAIYFLAVIR